MRLFEIKENFRKCFAKFIIDLAKEHATKARELGIVNSVCENYDEARALRYLDDKSYTSRFILNDYNQFVGVIVYEILSDNYIYLHKLFIDEDYRRRGYGTQVIKYLQSHYSVIQLEVWYSLSSELFYKKLGFNQISGSSNINAKKYEYRATK